MRIERKESELSRSSSRSVRRGNTFSLQSISAAEVTDLMQQTVEKTSLWDRVKPYISVVLWIMWVISGTMFYALYDEFGWAKGLLMSVNVGWSIAWALPGEPSKYYSPVSKVFTIFHATVGAIFLGVAVLFMEQDMLETKDSWIIMSTKRDEIENAEMDNSWWHHLKALWRYYMSKLRIARYSVLWIAFGCFWYSFYHDFDTFFGVLDFLASTLCAGGYMSLPLDATSLQYVVTALYATIGIPLIKVSLGLILSLILRNSEDKLVYEKMVAPVTKHEQEFMEAFGVDDGDGTIDYKEYVILIAVRIGSVPPNLVKEIQDRFRMLDRKQCGEIQYNDLLLPKVRRAGSGRMTDLIRSLSGSFRGEKSSSVAPNDKGPKGQAKVGPLPSAQGDTECSSSPVTPYSGEVEQVDEEDTKSDGRVHPPLKSMHDKNSAEKVRLSGVVNTSLQASDSIEVIELSGDDTNNDAIIQKQNFSDDDNDSIRSIDTFDGDQNDDATDMDLSKVTECRGASEATNSLPSTKNKQVIKASFRASMIATTSRVASGEHSSAPEGKLSPRQKEFLGELEKIRSAQAKVNSESHSSGFVRFLYFKLLPHSASFAAWTLWLAGGAVFYTIRENVSVSKGLFMSTSFGYGVFWIGTRGDTLTNVYTTFHFLIGIGVIAAAYVLLAQKLLSQDKNWYNDALKAKKLQEAMETEGLWDDVLALCEFYWPHVKVHCVFVCLLIFGTAFASLTFGWGFLDCLYFSISTMTSGGVIPLPEDASGWMYLVTCFYVAIGVPVMSISCGILAHQIASRGSAQLKAEKVNAQLTHEEIEKMKWYGIDDANGSIDSKEYVILILVRIGAISPEIISVLQDRFDQLDVKKCGKISYEDLRQSSRDEVVESPV